MMNVILKPIITEKATILTEQNKTVFKVDNSANKKIIKNFDLQSKKLMIN